METLLLVINTLIALIVASLNTEIDEKGKKKNTFKTPTKVGYFLVSLLLILPFIEWHLQEKRRSENDFSLQQNENRRISDSLRIALLLEKTDDLSTPIEDLLFSYELSIPASQSIAQDYTMRLLQPNGKNWIKDIHVLNFEEPPAVEIDSVFWIVKPTSVDSSVGTTLLPNFNNINEKQFCESLSDIRFILQIDTNDSRWLMNAFSYLTPELVNNRNKKLDINPFSDYPFPFMSYSLNENAFTLKQKFVEVRQKHSGSMTSLKSFKNKLIKIVVYFNHSHIDYKLKQITLSTKDGKKLRLSNFIEYWNSNYKGFQALVTTDFK